MDTSAIIVKLIGLILFLFTVRSVYKHFKGKIFKRRSPAEARQTASISVSADKQKPEPPQQQQQPPQHSKAEYALNAFLLYAWFIFMTALSLGMIVNN
ncbi:hypothetical protein R80B4_02772 [Fibrobacteres bacterium R8-0-B4]